MDKKILWFRHLNIILVINNYLIFVLLEFMIITYILILISVRTIFLINLICLNNLVKYVF
jgi:hypothetical protein